MILFQTFHFFLYFIFFSFVPADFNHFAIVTFRKEKLDNLVILVHIVCLPSKNKLDTFLFGDFFFYSQPIWHNKKATKLFIARTVCSVDMLVFVRCRVRMKIEEKQINLFKLSVYFIWMHCHATRYALFVFVSSRYWRNNETTIVFVGSLTRNV